MSSSGYRPDEIDLDHVSDVGRRMLRTFNRTYEHIDLRRAHRHTWETVDPDLSQRQGDDPDPNDLFALADRFQSREINIWGRKLVDRICENPWSLTMAAFASSETATQEKLGNKIAQVLMSWGIDIEDRMEMQIQRLLADYGVYDKGYAVFHVRMCEDLWPEIEWMPSDSYGGMREEEKDFTCPGCGGESAELYSAECAQCDSEGTIKRPMMTLMGRGKDYTDTVHKEYAERGAPWIWEAVDPRNVAFERDQDPRGGLRRFMRHYEVLLDDYADDIKGEVGPEKVRELRAAFALPGDRHTDVSSETPSSMDIEGNRVTVYQLWTRSHLYEWVTSTHAGSAGKVNVKGGPHGYPRIPFRIVAARKNGSADPFWAYEGDLDNMYAIKPWADKQITLMGGAMQNTVQPLINVTVDEPGKVPYLADGVPDDGGGRGTLAARQPVAGMKSEVVSAPMPAAIAQFWQEIKQMLAEARPDTGDVDLDKVTDAWGIKMGQAQGGKGPKAHIKEHKETLDWGFRLMMDTHIERKLPLIAYGRDENTRKVNTTEPMVVPWEELKGFSPNAVINPISAAEQQMNVEHVRGLLAEQLVEPEKFYEARGERDPHEAHLKNMAYWAAYPYMLQAIQGKLAEVMGSQFLLGVNGEMLNAAGQPVMPEQVLQQAGYQPGGTAPAPGGTPGGGGQPGGGNGLAQVRGQVNMPPLPGLNIPGSGLAPQAGGRYG